MIANTREKLHTFTTILLYMLLPFFLLYVMVINVNPSGKRSFIYTFDEPHAMISTLFPAQRLSGVHGGLQQVREEPIYFTVRYPRSYEQASIRLTVQNQSYLKWQVGMETLAQNDWSYVLNKPDENGTVVFNLQNARITNNSLRFIIAIQDIDQTSHFYIDDISLTFYRTPLWRP